MTAPFAATRTPEETARLAAAYITRSDAAFGNLGMEILAAGPGSATLAMTVAETMTNGHDTAHGGYIFTLADTAFAVACNSYGTVTVASQGAITFIRPGKRGDRLLARAREVSRSGRNGIYDVTVSVGDVVIAEFRGHSRTIGGSFLDGAADADAAAPEPADPAS